MSRIVKALASLYLTTWIMVTIILWLGWGAVMSECDVLEKSFKYMNSVLVSTWLLARDNDSHLLKFWFIVLCLLMCLLGVNLIFCVFDRIYRGIKAKLSAPGFCMLLVHALFGVVALLHLLGMTTGFKQSDISLGEGMSCNLENGYEIRVSRIVFDGNLDSLGKKYCEIRDEDFHYRSSYAEVVISQKGRELVNSNIYAINPLKHGTTRITLKGFIKPGGRSPGQKDAHQTPWVRMAVTTNPILGAFLAIYPLMIAGMGIYLILTWRIPSMKLDQSASPPE